MIADHDEEEYIAYKGAFVMFSNPRSVPGNVRLLDKAIMRLRREYLLSVREKGTVES